ncbi:2,4'-dihydroxyacetophenone dioxygenase family protein [Solibacillus cecembensis]|uniref:2,4'-dihydroxyacetophenone dioxygenase family protein n=1 Tax=Solibacillus cecembensis TaxID=459347 RepID=UPI000716E97A
MSNQTSKQLEGVMDANYVNVEALPWFDFFGTEAKLCKVNAITGQFIAILKGKPGSALPIHVHHGLVIVHTIQGQWKYLEHDWIAKAGDVVYEPAASLHTLIVPEDQEEDAILMNIVDGAIEFRDENGQIIYMLNWREAVQLYLNHCEEHNLEVLDLGQGFTN